MNAKPFFKFFWVDFLHSKRPLFSLKKLVVSLFLAVSPIGSYNAKIRSNFVILKIIIYLLPKPKFPVQGRNFTVEFCATAGVLNQGPLALLGSHGTLTTGPRAQDLLTVFNHSRPVNG